MREPAPYSLTIGGRSFEFDSAAQLADLFALLRDASMPYAATDTARAALARHRVETYQHMVDVFASLRIEGLALDEYRDAGYDLQARFDEQARTIQRLEARISALEASSDDDEPLTPQQDIGYR